jgi:hypothetical protein
MIPAAMARESSLSVLPGPAKLTLIGGTPVSKATCISRADATSNPSTSVLMCCTTAGMGLALIA